MVKYCANCGIELPDEAMYCPECGKKYIPRSRADDADSEDDSSSSDYEFLGSDSEDDSSLSDEFLGSDSEDDPSSDYEFQGPFGPSDKKFEGPFGPHSNRGSND